MTYNLILPENFQKVPLPGLTPWLEALRSGDYQQGTQRLAIKFDNSYRYCCLGLLCTIEKIPSKYKTNGYVYFNGSYTELQVGIRQYDVLSSAGALPKGVDVVIVEIGVHYDYLAGLNDNGLTFLQIADILEACFTHID